MSETETETLKITLVKSPIGYTKRQKATVQALGLRKIGQSVERLGTDPIRGMVSQVSHLLEVEELS